MDSARQVLRWSIPGMVFVTVLFAVNISAAAALYGRDPLLALSEVSTSGVVALIFGGVPVGFLLYQLYYASYRSHATFRGRIVFLRRDRGGLALKKYLALGGVPSVLDRADMNDHGRQLQKRIKIAKAVKSRTALGLLTLSRHVCGKRSAGKPDRCASCMDAYRDAFVRNWRLFQTVLDATDLDPRLRPIKLEYTSGSDLYHALGASRRALSLAGVLGLSGESVAYFYDATSAGPFGRLAVWLAVWALVLLALWYSLTNSRRSVDADYRDRVAAVLAYASRHFPNAMTRTEETEPVPGGARA